MELVELGSVLSEKVTLYLRAGDLEAQGLMELRLEIW